MNASICLWGRLWKNSFIKQVLCILRLLNISKEKIKMNNRHDHTKEKFYWVPVNFWHIAMEKCFSSIEFWKDFNFLLAYKENYTGYSHIFITILQYIYIHIYISIRILFFNMLNLTAPLLNYYFASWFPR